MMFKIQKSSCPTPTPTIYKPSPIQLFIYTGKTFLPLFFYSLPYRMRFLAVFFFFFIPYQLRFLSVPFFKFYSLPYGEKNQNFFRHPSYLITMALLLFFYFEVNMYCKTCVFHSIFTFHNLIDE